MWLQGLFSWLMARILNNICTTWTDFLFCLELGDLAIPLSDIVLNRTTINIIPSQGAHSSLSLMDGYSCGNGA